MEKDYLKRSRCNGCMAWFVEKTGSFSLNFLTLVPNQGLTKMICAFYSKIMFFNRGAKGDVYEGGTRVPGLLYYKR